MTDDAAEPKEPALRVYFGEPTGGRAVLKMTVPRSLAESNGFSFTDFFLCADKIGNLPEDGRGSYELVMKNLPEGYTMEISSSYDGKDEASKKEAIGVVESVFSSLQSALPDYLPILKAEG
jgi:hypothetical protein